MSEHSDETRSILEAIEAREQVREHEAAAREQKAQTFVDEHRRKIATRIAKRALKAAHKGETGIAVHGGPLGLRRTKHYADAYREVETEFRDRGVNIDFAVTRHSVPPESFMTPLGEWHIYPRPFDWLRFTAIGGEPIDSSPPIREIEQVYSTLHKE